jgi:hypothetical protein
MSWVLRLIEDTLTADAAPLHLPACPRVIYAVHGGATLDGIAISDDAMHHAAGALTLKSGESGVTLWRWELVQPGTRLTHGERGHRAVEKLSATIDRLPAAELLLRGDSVAFPPGGCAYLHTHRGPGIRCLIEGGIRIDTDGHSVSYGPGAAWFEAGPVAVFAQAAADRPSRFIRCMVLPRELLGKSSIRYERAEDQAKPKSQQYRVYVDAPITL